MVGTFFFSFDFFFQRTDHKFILRFERHLGVGLHALFLGAKMVIVASFLRYFWKVGCLTCVITVLAFVSELNKYYMSSFKRSLGKLLLKMIFSKQGN